MQTTSSNLQSDLFVRAADSLLMDVPSPLDTDVAALLSALDFDQARLSAAARLNRGALLRAAACFTRIFQLPLVDAPGLVFLGGEVDPARIGITGSTAGVMSVGGLGVSTGEALQACVGEGVEYLSQMEDGTEASLTATTAELLDQPNVKLRGFLASLPLPKSSHLQALRAIGLTTDHAVLLPAEICIRRLNGVTAFTPPFRLSMGCAAGPTIEDATLHAVCELIERDAAGLWWRGGRRGRPLNLEDNAFQRTRTYLRNLRGGATGRRTWLLDITTDLEVPVAVAISSSADGHGFAFGLGARTSLDVAAIGALKEMCQNELAHHVVAAKREERGETGLNDRDRAHLARASQINAATDALLQPVGAPRLNASAALDGTAEHLGWLLAKLTAAGIDVFRMDLTRPRFNVPVVRVFAPGLQIEPSTLVSSRLAMAQAQCSDAALWRDRPALF
jgi:ribosomal protein S12 methylthiotransferase accessory factor